MRRFYLFPLKVAFLGVALFIIYTQLQRYPAQSDIHSHSMIDSPVDNVDIGGPFSLIDQHGKRCTSEQFKGKYMIVYFGYSYCPDACPLALQNITKALHILQKDRDQVHTIFITLDPARDTVEQLKLYSDNYDPNFYFLTGKETDIDKVASDYKTFAKKMETSTTTEYLVDHSTLIYFMDREGKLAAYFPHSTDPEAMARTLRNTMQKEHIKTQPSTKKNA